MSFRPYETRVCSTTVYVFLSTLPTHSLEYSLLQWVHRRQAIFTLALNLTVCPSHGITLIWRDVTSDILIRVNYIRVSLERRGVRFWTSDVQAFEKTMAGLTLALRELIRTFLTRLTALVVSACAIVITSCCHSLPLDTGEFCFRVAVRLERVTSHPERSSAVVEHRVVYPTYAYTPAGICGPCV